MLRKISILLIFFFSFLLMSFSSQNVENFPKREFQNFKTYNVLVSQNWTLGGCVFTFSMTLSFSWNGPGTPPTNISISNAAIQVNCSPTKPKTNLNARVQIDAESGHVTSIEFDTTGENDADAVLSDTDFKDAVKANCNSQIDSQ